ncbi:hypothetical protein KEJ13_02145 [Candidatus Bathyarchaeota archaeon]|nr:hypothetical protein [Candidatus Bathyarchaeota archaeon]
MCGYEYQTISGELYFGQSHHYYKEPYTISVRIDAVEPSGAKLRVAIYVNYVEKWFGYLGSEESSPTIVCEDQETMVDICNNT